MFLLATSGHSCAPLTVCQYRRSYRDHGEELHGEALKEAWMLEPVGVDEENAELSYRYFRGLSLRSYFPQLQKSLLLP
jgi:hypothetical protein